MRKVLLALMMTIVVASVQAITIQWTVPNSSLVNTSDGWEDWTTKLTGQSIYFVYSESKYSTAEEVWEATSGYKVVANENNSGDATVTNLAGGTVPANTTTIGFSFPDDTTINTWLAIGGSGYGTTGYYYLVVFDPTVASGDDPKYAVSTAVQYTGDKTTDTANGISETTVSAYEEPDVADFVDIGWMGGTWTAVTVPEPTALALLALGVAGLALRRKM